MSQAELDTLIGLVNSNRYTEVKCGRYLKYIVKRMVRNEGQLFEPIRNSTELALHRGRADFIISATNHQCARQRVAILHFNSTPLPPERGQ